MIRSPSLHPPRRHRAIRSVAPYRTPSPFDTFASMPTPRDVLALLSRDELLAVVDRFGLTPPDRRAKDGIIDTIVASPRATLPEILGTYPRDRLKELCRALHLDDSGREKALIVDRLASARAATAEPPVAVIEARAKPLTKKVAKTLRDPRVFVALDFETANTSRNSACAIGVVRVVDGVIVEKAYELIRPPERWFEFTYIHGITWSHVARAPIFDAVWAKLASLFAGCEFIAAHNASFDRSVLRACCAHYGLDEPPMHFECTMKLARDRWGIRPTKLPDVARHLGLPLKHHDAASDAEVCAKIMIAGMK
jgi:DNA polymerase-3 subunit epsilon